MLPSDFQIAAHDKPHVPGEFRCSRCGCTLPFNDAAAGIEWRDLIFRYCARCSAPPAAGGD